MSSILDLLIIDVCENCENFNLESEFCEVEQDLVTDDDPSVDDDTDEICEGFMPVSPD